MAYCQGPRRCGGSKPRREEREKKCPMAEVPMNRYIHVIPTPNEGMSLCRLEELVEEQNCLLRELVEQTRALKECCGRSCIENG